MKNRLFYSLVGACVITMIFTTTIIAQPSIPDIKGTKVVSIGLACKLTLIQGEKASLTITGDDDALDEIQIKMIGDKLKIFNENHHQLKKDVSITITLPDLERLSIGGAVDVISQGLLQYNDLTVDVSGVADLKLKLKTHVFTLEASGVLSGIVIGETDYLYVEISGVGKFDATEFKAKNCKAEVSGVARIAVNAAEKIDASVSGMGKINYLGNPIVRVNSSGIGRVKRL